MTINILTIKQLTLLIIGSIGISNLSAQSLKTYNGAYDRGSATYTYYEDNEYNRIFQGNFSYTGIMFNAKGQFEKGKENGKWTIWATNKVRQNPGGKFIINTAITGNFSDGDFNGLWSYSNSMRLWNFYSKKYDANDDKQTSIANFKNNHFIGKLSYTANWPSATKIDGQFTNSGMLDGTWLFESKSKRHIVKYLRGVAYSRLSQEKSTGEKLVFYDKLDFVTKFWENYDDISNTSIVDGKKYSPKNVRLLKTHSTEGVVNPDYSPTFEPLDNPAIELWTSDTVGLYQNQGLSNPLYCYRIDSKQLPRNPPYCYEVIIERSN